jgi:hypothetical protein
MATSNEWRLFKVCFRLWLLEGGEEERLENGGGLVEGVVDSRLQVRIMSDLDWRDAIEGDGSGEIESPGGRDCGGLRATCFECFEPSLPREVIALRITFFFLLFSFPDFFLGEVFDPSLVLLLLELALKPMPSSLDPELLIEFFILWISQILSGGVGKELEL